MGWLIFFAPLGAVGLRQIIKHQDDNGWWWILAGTLMAGAATGNLISDRDCYTDWDGRSNGAYCN